ncbi:hypothetical protein FFONT_1378 [Fervidicoccus fontis Kam940]|uniref:Uncharacterized protein n=1 Tax=Fervidicoccus fontis (strain DSM 19380 / JCM 18336 / VKM B-2539 / Kam940) TaxID=1163730 RepID=I0A309_FERFK|nr:hypothetical protein FFONT_1378 [Fervidicoccus fontis Kam940]
MWFLIEQEEKTVVGSVYDRVKMLLLNYGSKAEEVMLAALKRAEELDANGNGFRFGDFDFKGLKEKLTEMEVKYNPNILLRIMERDYLIIETTYKSGNQHWWNFTDRKAVESILLSSGKSSREKSGEDLKYISIKAMYASLEPGKLLEALESISRKRRLDDIDKRLFKKIVFEEMKNIVSLIESMKEMESRFEGELKVLYRIVDLIDSLSNKLIKE